MSSENKKYSGELSFWLDRFEAEGGKFANDHYRPIMLAMTGNSDDSFLKEKIVADFGCGPRGSLAWTEAPARRLGIDVLVPEYLEFFGAELARHGMDYVPATEDRILLPDACADVLFTINSLDHVDNLEVMATELLRILKPGGLFAGSFNLFEPANQCEPQSLDEEKIRSLFLKDIRPSSYRIALKHPQGTYRNLFDNKLVTDCDRSRPHLLWLTGHKKA